MESSGDKYEKKNPFSVPEGYFDQLADRVMERVKQEEKPQRAKFIQIIKPYIGLAAIFLIAFLVMPAVLSKVVHPEQLLKKENNSVASKEEWIEEEIFFDSQFNPTNEEIIEYLASEIDSYELMYAGIY